jgi:hypothetical protein
MNKFAVIKQGLVNNIVAGQADGIELLVDVFLPGADEVVEITEETGPTFIGGRYSNGKFQPPPPYTSWTFNEKTWSYDPPTPRPSGGQAYEWNGESEEWQLVTEFAPTE